MPPVVVDNPSESQFELRLDGKVIGRAEYRPAGDSVIVAHTEIDEGHEGKVSAVYWSARCSRTSAPAARP